MKTCIWIHHPVLKVFLNPSRYVGYRNPCMDLNNIQGLGLTGLLSLLRDEGILKVKLIILWFLGFSDCGKKSILIVYVDDIILTGDDLDELSVLKNYLAKEFEIKDLGFMKYFLGMEVAKFSQSGIVITQRKYTLDLLSETGMLGSKPVITPINCNHKLGRPSNRPEVDKGRYQQLVAVSVVSHSCTHRQKNIWKLCIEF